ncbi:MAG: DUF4437 domain-containing protein [Rhodospirillaceae bacterium]|jgi:hypothetical protein|nr:DUF4437 domain-containing protein [Rhodospirillaceae bacterium]MBT5945017.1 DUF4437 domain-containing protein [Rhodospirillaceae bacterium]MBT6402902.1 DUF4437 domain-containing protein [Rhodospirillaceae bacterium]MBT6535794.1 DUF4437 domain-containing protein [Rhodospirillaceae bacterium]
MVRSIREYSTVAAVLMQAALSPIAAQADSAFDEKKEVAMPAASLNFENINPAIRMATAFGDRATGQHGTFGKFPANFITPVHTHTGAYHGIVVKGVMTNPFKGETAAPELGAGSYWYVPAGSAHATACVSDTPCEFFFFADQGFDFHPVE